MTAPYPAEWELDALLSDGSPVHIRPIRPDDAAALMAFHEQLSAESIYRRFFSFHSRLSAGEVERFTTVDYLDRFALVAEIEGALAAVARYDRTPDSDRAEVAFIVADAHQGRGVGSLLLEHLAAAARQRGIAVFEAETLATNRSMLGVFRDAGFGMQTSIVEGVTHVRFPISETEGSLTAAEERERRAQVASLRRLLRPATVAVIGASRPPGTIGNALFRNLLEGGFEGTVYPVNPSATSVAGVRAYPHMSDVPEPVDLAVVAVPAVGVADVVEECGKAGVHGLVVISAGFAETGEAGAAMQAEVIRRARIHGMRVVGPNCMGVINTAPGVSMNATFAPTVPRPGRVGFLSQSGAVGIAILERAAELGLGLSTFVSVGNKADVSGNDLLQHWEADPSTDVILLYLESFGNPQRFARIARRVSRTKPIIALKSGRTELGARAARSHTAAAASSERVTAALFQQAGVIRASTLAEMFDVAHLLTNQPAPAGRRIAVVGNSGGPGIMAADACSDAGLELADLNPETSTALAAFLPQEASVLNPVDLIASATGEQYERALDLILDDPAVDMALVIFTPPLVTKATDVASAVIAAAGRHPTKPLAATFLTAGGQSALLTDEQTGQAVPVYAFPEQAIQALGRAAAYGTWLTRDEGDVQPLDPDVVAQVREIVTAQLATVEGDSVWMAPADLERLLGLVGIPVPASRTAATAEAAAAAADQIGYPVVVKAVAPAILHKTDVGGVALGLDSAEAVRAAYDSMAAALGDQLEGVLVQRLVPPGIETIIGVMHDQAFGPLVMYGLGGIATDVLGDVAFRFVPLSDTEADDLMSSVRAAPLLLGYRGQPAVDIDALRGILLRVAALAEAVPELAELDLNPVLVSPVGATAVDARARLQAVPPGPGQLARRLR